MSLKGILIALVPAMMWHAAPAALAGQESQDKASGDTPLFATLGTHHRAVTTRSALAQRYFDQGLRLLYAFDQEMARRSFAHAAALDPSCAMCFWGVAAALGPNINVPRMADFAEPAYAAAQEALRLSPEANPTERALIEAMARRFSPSLPDSPDARRALDVAYAQAMGEAANRFPADADVQTLFAESQMVLSPWNYWSKDGKPGPATPEIVAALGRAMLENPDHPGANHYYIHAVEASPQPEKALPAAERLGGLMPGAGHIVHMPSHIYVNVGRYHDAVLANESAAQADQAYKQLVTPGPIYFMYSMHNLQFLSFAAMMTGQSRTAIAAARQAAREMPAQTLHHMPEMDAVMAFPSLALLRFGQWEAVLDEPAPPAGHWFPEAIWHHARGVALAHLGRPDEAQAELARVVSARDAAPEGAIRGLNSARALLGIATDVLEAEIAEARGDRERAIALLSASAQAEDDLRYFEPPDWVPPVRHRLGAALLAAGRAAEAEATYREDLERNPENGWSLFGLLQSLTAQGKHEQAAQVKEQFDRAWAHADVALTRSPDVRGTHSGDARPLELDDLFRARRISDPQLSPDGKWIAYVVTDVDKAANKTHSQIWLMASSGSSPRQLTVNPKNDRHPRWSPDSRRIAFESNRSGSSQIWIISIVGGEAQPLTRISTEASQPVWSPDGQTIAFVSAVYPEFSDKPFQQSDALNKQKNDEKASSPVKARVITRLLYRHWDSWVDDKRQHIFVVPVHGGDPMDLTPGDRDAVPTSSTFSAGDDFAFSPDGQEIAYTATPAVDEAWSTNHDIYVVPVAGGTPRQITTNPAADGFPRYSPDGRTIAYRAQRRPGFEADRWELMAFDRRTGESRSLTEHFDSSVEAFVWANDSRRLYFPAEHEGNVPLYTVSHAGNDVKKVVDKAVNGDVHVSPDGRRLVFTHQTMTRPVEIYSAGSDGRRFRPLTRINDALFAGITMTPPESVVFTGEGGARVQMWIVKPPMFDPGRKYPLVLWVHGGPQTAFLDAWSYRWNVALWAAQGYVMALPNPRGSTGFGQQFVDEISGDWGGKAFEDLMKGLAYMEQEPYVDATRMAAAGASYGGYMMNWFQGNTDKFRTLVTHCGVYNFHSMYGTTDEVWFDEWEHGGPPWEKPEEYDKFSPHTRAEHFKTPNLIIHNELDFRVPVSEGLQLFTTLQRKGIPSRLLYFPDEGHWVLKPANSELWHRTVFDWLSEYLK
jgi:dipeptidyl aminopeptidase/acylaminoacyl peptidase/tetratricopeptide (TPR) repeat protein